jgi:hypothetical protein
VHHIPCGTRGGVMTSFERVTVVNMLPREHVLETVKAYGTNYDRTWIFDKVRNDPAVQHVHCAPMVQSYIQHPNTHAYVMFRSTTR